jgi:hypothetical protein
MPHHTRFCLIANIEHFTSVLENFRMDARQVRVAELLLAESWYRLADLEASGTLPADQTSLIAIPPPMPTEQTAPAATPPVAPRPSVSTATARHAPFLPWHPSMRGVAGPNLWC